MGTSDPESLAATSAFPTSQYVQYGCGLCAPDGWINYDASPSLRLQRVPLLGRVLQGNIRFPRSVRYGDIVRGLPEADGSTTLVYCSHVLEHLAPEDLRAALRNTQCILRPGGVFRLVLPDLEAYIRAYLANPGEQAAYAFIKTTLRPERRPRGVRAIVSAAIGNSDHLWMWDFRSLAAELAAAGFTGVRRARFGDNPDPMLRAVEAEDRWDGSLGIESVR